MLPRGGLSNQHQSEYGKQYFGRLCWAEAVGNNDLALVTALHLLQAAAPLTWRARHSSTRGTWFLEEGDCATVHTKTGTDTRCTGQAAGARVADKGGRASTRQHAGAGNYRLRRANVDGLCTEYTEDTGHHLSSTLNEAEVHALQRYNYLLLNS